MAMLVEPGVTCPKNEGKTKAAHPEGVQQYREYPKRCARALEEEIWAVLE